MEKKPAAAAEQQQLVVHGTTDNGLQVMDDSLNKKILQRLQDFQKQMDYKPRKVVRETILNESFEQIPISFLEHELKKMFFGLCQFECVSYAMIVNEITVHARIKVYHPIIRQWLSYDGVAAIPVQQDKDTKVNEFMSAKKSKAMAKNLPAAYAIAIKNAAKKIGKRFGGDLNRKHEDIYDPFPIKDEPLNV